MMKKTIAVTGILIALLLGLMVFSGAQAGSVTLSQEGEPWVWPVNERGTYALVVPATVTNGGDETVRVALRMKAVNVLGQELLTEDGSLVLAPGQTKAWTSRMDVSAELLQSLRNARIEITSVTPAASAITSREIDATVSIDDPQANPIRVSYSLSDPAGRALYGRNISVTLMYWDARGTLLYAHTITPDGDTASGGALRGSCQLDSELSSMLSGRAESGREIRSVTALAYDEEDHSSGAPATAAPSSRKGTWLNRDEFAVQDLGGRFSVDFTAYARAKGGEFYVIWDYDCNSYYDSGKTDGLTAFERDGVPGVKLFVRVYWMGDDTEQPAYDRWADAAEITLNQTGAFTRYGFMETAHSAAVVENGLYHDVAAYSLNDARDENVDKRIHFTWYHTLQTDTTIDCFGVLYTPGGEVYTESCGYQFRKNNSGGSEFNYTLDYLFEKYNRLNGPAESGSYLFEAYLEGQLADRTEFIVAQTRQDPASPSPVPTATPTPVPTARPGAWLNRDEFTVQDLGGRFRVDIGGYAGTGNSEYIVYWEYDANRYYTSASTDGESWLENAAVPGEKLWVSVYRMGEGEEKPVVDWSQAVQINLSETGTFTNYGFRETDHSAAVFENGKYHDVAAFSLSDIQDENVDKRIRYYWIHNQQTETAVNCLAVLYTPNGTFYVKSDAFPFRSNNSGGGVFYYNTNNLTKIFNEYQRLNGSIELGTYRFDLYLEGQLADRTEFEVAQTRRDPASPSPVPTATPTPVPTARPGAWLEQSEFTVKDLGGRFRVEFGDYARTHDGEYYVFWEYDQNTYYSSNDTDGNAYYENAAVPGQKLWVSVYWMGDDEEKPNADWSRAAQINLSETGTFNRYGFRETEHTATIYDGKNYRDVTAYSMEEVLDDNVLKRIHFYWYHDLQTETVIDCLGVLYAPNGEFYFATGTYTFDAGNSGGDYFHYSSVGKLFEKYNRLNGSVEPGSYRYELYLEGQLADRTEFEVTQTGQSPSVSGSTRSSYAPDNEYFANGELKKEYLYNREGRVYRILTYNRYGKAVTEETVNAWDEDGYILRSTVQSPYRTGKFSRTQNECTYDARGNRITQRSTYADGSFRGSWSYQYDDSNLLVRLVYYKEDGSVSYTQDGYQYDADGRMVGNVRRDADGSATEYYSAVWQNGVRTSSTRTDPKGNVLDDYTYDPVYGDVLTNEYVSSGSRYKSIYTYHQDSYEEDWYALSSGRRYVTTYSTVDIRTGDVIYKYNKTTGKWDLSSTVVYSSNADGTSSETEKFADGSRTERTKDQNGYVILSRSYNADGSFNYAYSYENDGDGRTLRSNSLTADGKTESYTLYEYDKDGNQVRSTTYNADGSFAYAFTSEYNSQGQEIRQNYYRESPGKLYSYTLYEYDSDGKLVHSIDYRADGTKSWESYYRTTSDGRDQHRFISYNSDGSVYKDYGWEEY